MLKITKAADPIHIARLNLCLYGAPGIGKTTLAFTASRPLLLDFDNGVHRAANRRDAVQISEWSEIANITAPELAAYDTIIVDTAGRALDMLTLDIIRRDPKKGSGGALTLQGYGALKAAFTSWLNLLNSFGKDVLLITHMEEQRKGDDVIERIDVQGGSKGEIYKSADAMGRLSIMNGQRLLTFSPSDTAFGKNPGGLDAMTVPSVTAEPQFLAGVIQSIKDKLNALTEAQRQAQAEVEEARTKFGRLETAEQFNAEAAQLTSAPSVIKQLLVAVAKEKGIWFNKETKQFVPPVEEGAA